MSSDKVFTKPISIEVFEEHSSLVFKSPIAEENLVAEVTDLISTDDDLDSLLESLMVETGTVTGTETDDEISKLEPEESEVVTKPIKAYTKPEVSNPTKVYKTLTKLTVRTNPSVFEKLKASFILKTNSDDENEIEDDFEQFQQEANEKEQLDKDKLQQEKQEQERIRDERLKIEKAKKEILEQKVIKAEKLKQKQQDQERLEEGKVKAEAERVEAEKAKAEKAKAEKAKAEKAKAEKAKADRIRAEKLEAVKAEAKKIAAERLEAEKAVAVNAEAARVEEEKLEAEMIKAEKFKSAKERAEAAKLKLEQLTKEKIELNKRKQEQIELEKLKQEISRTENHEKAQLHINLDTENLENEVEYNDIEKLKTDKLEKELKKERSEKEALIQELEKAKSNQEISVQEEIEKSEQIETKSKISNNDDSILIKESQAALNYSEDSSPNAQDEELNEKIEVLSSIKAVGDSFESRSSKLIETVEDLKSTIYFGNAKDISSADNFDNICYNPNEYMISALLENSDEAKRTSEVIRLKIESILIIIDYSLNTIHSNVDPASDEYRKLCCDSTIKHTIEKSVLSYVEARTQRAQSRKNPTLTHPIETFIATSTLLTAQGRLPKGIDLTEKVLLKEGINISVFELVPHCYEILQEIKLRSKTLLELSTLNEIPQKYIFSFYNIALNLNLLDSVVELPPKKKIAAKSIFKSLFRK